MNPDNVTPEIKLYVQEIADRVKSQLTRTLSIIVAVVGLLSALAIYQLLKSSIKEAATEAAKEAIIGAREQANETLQHIINTDQEAANARQAIKQNAAMAFSNFQAIAKMRETLVNGSQLAASPMLVPETIVALPADRHEGWKSVPATSGDVAMEQKFTVTDASDAFLVCYFYRVRQANKLRHWSGVLVKESQGNRPDVFYECNGLHGAAGPDFGPSGHLLLNGLAPGDYSATLLDWSDGTSPRTYISERQMYVIKLR